MGWFCRFCRLALVCAFTSRTTASAGGGRATHIPPCSPPHPSTNSAKVVLPSHHSPQSPATLPPNTWTRTSSPCRCPHRESTVHRSAQKSAVPATPTTKLDERCEGNALSPWTQCSASTQRRVECRVLVGCWRGLALVSACLCRGSWGDGAAFSTRCGRRRS